MAKKKNFKKYKTLSAGWTIDWEKDITQFGIDFEEEMVKVLAAEITKEVDAAIVDEMLYGPIRKVKRKMYEALRR